MAKVLVTGATGMVGAHVCIDLLKKGYDVTALKRESSDLSLIKSIFEFYNAADFDKIQFKDAALTDIVMLEEIIEGVDIVVHCAAKVSFSKKDDKELFLTNHDGTANLVNVILKFPKIYFIHISSIATLGHSSGETVDETTPKKDVPNTSTYSLTKLMAEMEVWRAVEEGMKAAILNPSFIIGPGNWYYGSPSIFRKIKQGINFYPTGGTGFVDVRDVAQAVILVLEKNIESQRIIINAENLSYRNFITKVAHAREYKIPQKALSKNVLVLLLPLIRFYFFLRRKKNPLNKAMIANLFNSSSFSNEKSIALLQMNYRTVEDSIENTWKFFGQQ